MLLLLIAIVLLVLWRYHDDVAYVSKNSNDKKKIIKRLEVLSSAYVRGPSAALNLT